MQDNQGHLWIAKFPGADDDHDWALREMLLHQLAHEFELNVAPARLEKVGSGYPPEKAHIFEQLIFHALGEGYIEESKAAELMKISLTAFQKVRSLEGGDAATGQ